MRKRFIRLLSALALSLCGCNLYAQTNTVTDQLLALLLEKHLPAPLYEQGSNPWPGGNYKLEVHKAGRPEVVSATDHIHVKLPLQVRMAGDMANNMLQIKLTCSTRFDTVGEIVFAPTKPGDVSSLASAITLPIPPAMADCDGMKFPVDAYIKTLVAQNKRQWELRLDEEIKTWMAK
jgi:hypothetical protein